uniref:Cuticlin n=1 Tax=Hemiscolopendra marginata TaxID=943146 RepID=A0A646QFR2_9MYRI
MIPRKTFVCLLVSVLISAIGAQNHLSPDHAAIEDVHVVCNSDNILVTLRSSAEFNGLIYPKGLAKNSSCMNEYSDASGEIIYSMPLHSCNTMSTDVTDGVEYFNTVVVQPHRRLVTNQGRGFHIRCRYHTKDKTVQIGGVNISDLNAVPYEVDGEIPLSVMKIYIGDDDRQLHQAENVKIGDELRMVIAIDAQNVYGMKVTNCLVRDGLNWGEQQLINNQGCSVDRELMGELDYSSNKTAATIRFQAHKFPYTSSVYYQCTVNLCLHKNGDCDDVPPLCTSDGRNLRRRKRQLTANITEEGNLTALNEADVKDLSVSVHSGLHVNDPVEEEPEETQPAIESSEDSQAFCISARLFAIIIAIAGLILMAAVILLVVVLIQRRRRRKDISTTAGSSIYSGPYSNHAYSST